MGIYFIVIIILCIIFMISNFGIKNQNLYLIKFYKGIAIYIFLGNIIIYILGKYLRRYNEIEILFQNKSIYIIVQIIVLAFIYIIAIGKGELKQSLKEFSLKYIWYGIQVYFISLFAIFIVSVFSKNEIKTTWIEDMVKSENDLSISIALFLMIGVLAPVAEEMLFRVFLIKGLSIRLDKISTVSFAALIFAIMHWNFSHFFAYYVFGAVYSIAYIHYKNIYVVLIAHILNNSIYFFLLKYF